MIWSHNLQAVAMRTAMVAETATMATDVVITGNLTKDSMAVFTIKDMEG